MISLLYGLLVRRNSYIRKGCLVIVSCVYPMWHRIAQRTATAVLGILTWFLGKPRPLPVDESERWSHLFDHSPTPSPHHGIGGSSSTRSWVGETLTAESITEVDESSSLIFLFTLLKLIPAEYILLLCVCGLLFIVQLFGCGLCLCCVGIWCTLRAGVRFVLKVIIRSTDDTHPPIPSPTVHPSPSSSSPQLSELARSILPAVEANDPTIDTSVPIRRKHRENKTFSSSST